MSNACFLIDSSIYVFRYYFASNVSHLSKSGREVSTVLAFTRWLMRLLIAENPKHIALCFDESLGTGFRHKIDETYKASRALPDEALTYELLACKKIAEYLGLATYASEEFEADDLLAALADFARSKKIEPFIISRDKDLAQILQAENGCLWDYPYADALNYHEFKVHFGIAPELMADYLAIAGDSVDGIEGVRGVGKKTLSTLFEHFAGWQKIKENLHKVSSLPMRAAASLEQKLNASIDLIEHNLTLTQLRSDSLDKKAIILQRQAPDIESLTILLNEFNASKKLYAYLEEVNENYCR